MKIYILLWIVVCALVFVLAASVLRNRHTTPRAFQEFTPTIPASSRPTPDKPITSSSSVPTTKHTLFLMKLREATDKQGWLIDSFIEKDSDNLIIRGYLTVMADGIVRAGHVNHPVFEGNISRLRAEEQQDKSNPDSFFNVDPLYYRGSPINSKSNCAFFRANGFTKVEAINIDTGRSWDLCGDKH